MLKKVRLRNVSVLAYLVAALLGLVLQACYGTESKKPDAATSAQSPPKIAELPAPSTIEPIEQKPEPVKLSVDLGTLEMKDSDWPIWMKVQEVILEKIDSYDEPVELAVSLVYTMRISGDVKMDSTTTIGAKYLEQESLLMIRTRDKGETVAKTGYRIPHDTKDTWRIEKLTPQILKEMTDEGWTVFEGYEGIDVFYNGKLLYRDGEWVLN